MTLFHVLFLLLSLIVGAFIQTVDGFSSLYFTFVCSWCKTPSLLLCMCTRGSTRQQTRHFFTDQMWLSLKAALGRDTHRCEVLVILCTSVKGFILIIFTSKMYFWKGAASFEFVALFPPLVDVLVHCTNSVANPRKLFSLLKIYGG